MREGEEMVDEPFGRLIADDRLIAYKHEGFWRPMDTLRDGQCWRTWSSGQHALVARADTQAHALNVARKVG